MARGAKRANRRKNAPAQHPGAFPVVAIGASAGGIGALSQFFDAMPADSGMAFVVVLHLDPTHESQLASIVGHHTAMPVREITEGIRIESDHVYVIAPDSYVTVSGGEIRISEPTEPRGHRYPVDALFASLASEQKERAVCIVLSGTGHNGTQGLREVKAQGGCTLVQDPQTAQFDGMPRNAIAAGVADQVLAPEKMPAFLTEYVRHGYFTAPAQIDSSSDDALRALDPIMTQLRIQSGNDFRSYKKTTIQRRIHRRMGVLNVETLPAYAEQLRANPEEAQALARDLMISVTGFFRDPEAWSALDKAVLKPLVAARDADAEARFWVTACSTGEEAYTLAMLATERCEAAQVPLSLRIFATDSREDNLRHARDGIYPQAAMADVSPERLARFFERLDDTYQVKRELRELVVFAPHNLLRDPPFSRLDLITCRNFLIYLEPEMQKRVVALLHFALREGGHLLLGNAETVGRHEDLFETISKTWRIYRRLGPTRHDIVDFPLLGAPVRLHQPSVGSAQPLARPPVQAPAEVARQALLESYAPASVLVDEKCRIHYFHGPTGDYLEPPPGEPTRDLLAMAREDIRPHLRSAMRRALEERSRVTFRARVRRKNTADPVQVTVAPLASGNSGGRQLLVSFEPAPEPSGAEEPPASHGERGGDDDAARQRALEQELQATRAELLNTREQMESANEELKAANEEVTSMNEELQSTNEELETSKEELQSYNEELHTVNNQLRHKVQELDNLTNDQKNLLNGTEIATLFLDTDLRIKWFSPSTGDLLDLVPSDVGRPIGNFAWKIVDESLPRHTAEVLESLTRIEAEVRSDAGRWYLRRILPYRTEDNRIEGVVITFSDITERKEAMDRLDKARVYAEGIVETLRQPLLIVDGEMRVVSANRVFYELFKVSRAEIEGHRVYDLGNGQWDIPDLRRLLEVLLAENEEITDFVVEHEFESLGQRTMILNARRLVQPLDGSDLILVVIEDITESEQAESHRRLLVAELNHRVKNVLAMVQSLASHTIRQSESMDSFKAAFESRLVALAHAHDLLVKEDWGEIQTADLVRRIVGPYGGARDQIRVDDSRLALDARQSTALVMILHELVTNAAKYGALSVEDGRLRISWRLDKARSETHLYWQETGGPSVAPPSRRGFGTRLIERSAAYELSGAANLDFRKEGLHCEITFPWRKNLPGEDR